MIPIENIVLHAKEVIRKADGIYLGNLEYWLVKWAKDDYKSIIPRSQYKDALSRLQDEGYVIQYGSIYEPGSKLYELKIIK